MEKLQFPGSPAPRKSPVSIKHDSPHPPPLPSPAQPSPGTEHKCQFIFRHCSSGECWPVRCWGRDVFVRMLLCRDRISSVTAPHCMGVIIFMSLLYSHKTLNLAKHAAAAVRFRSDHLNGIILAWTLTNEILCSFVGKIFLFPPFPVKS